MTCLKAASAGIRDHATEANLIYGGKVKSILAIVFLLLAAGCKDFPGADGRYATPGRGGWDNFRAGAPSDQDGMVVLATGTRD